MEPRKVLETWRERGLFTQQKAIMVGNTHIRQTEHLRRYSDGLHLMLEHVHQQASAGGMDGHPSLAPMCHFRLQTGGLLAYPFLIQEVQAPVQKRESRVSWYRAKNERKCRECCTYNNNCHITTTPPSKRRLTADTIRTTHTSRRALRDLTSISGVIRPQSG
jgi:hypothetical protein